MNAKQFIVEVYERHSKAVENGYDLRMEESEWLEIMEEYADHKLDMARKNSGNFTNGSFTLFCSPLRMFKFSTNVRAANWELKALHYQTIKM